MATDDNHDDDLNPDDDLGLELEQDQENLGLEGDQESGRDDPDHHDDNDDGRVGGQEALDADDPEREEIRARRREERHLKRQRVREREDQFRRDLAARDAVIGQLSERLNQIDRRNNGFDLANIDSQIAQLNSAYNNERERIKSSVESNDGVAAATATENMMRIRERFNQLTQVRQAYTQNQQKPPPLDPRLVQYANDWQSKNRWYNSNGSDMDSRIVRLIDDQLAQEGFNPSTEGYWNELTDRVKQQLPHQFKSAPRPNGRNGSPPVGGSSRAAGSGAGKNGGGTMVSPERVRALQDAGLWDDPVKRKAALESYKKYDREHSGEAR